jgi:cell division transport system permease protein
MWLSLKRIAKTGAQSFWRNGFVSVSAVTVTTITLLVMSTLLCVNALLNTALTQIEDKVDINAYFVIDAPEDAMQRLRDTLARLPEVHEVVYTSREEALARFKERHAQDTIELQALEELGENPLLASLSIRAKDPSAYEYLATFLDTDPSTLGANGASLVAKVNFNDNRTAIERLQHLIHGITLFGTTLSLALGLASVVIVYNTIRMVIYMAREEIAVMRLVGASDAYVRGPFVFEGALYGAVSALITLIILFPLALWLGPVTRAFFGSTDVYQLYLEHFGRLTFLLFATGILFGALSSMLSVRKYLRI